MVLRALGYATEAAFVRFDGAVEAGADFVVLRTPANPDYVWGNAVVFASPPTPQDLDPERDASWIAIVERAFASHPGVRHRLIAWDAPDGEAGAASSHVPPGFTLDETVVLTGAAVHPPPRADAELAVRRLDGDDDWAQARALLVRAFSERTPELRDAQVRHVDQQLPRYRRLISAGLGAWYGGFLGGTLAGTCGVFVFDGVGRYQLVGTSPEHRGRGVCGTLVAATKRDALASLGARTLAICADATYHAWRIYASVGLAPTERLVALLRRAPPVTPFFTMARTTMPRG